MVLGCAVTIGMVNGLIARRKDRVLEQEMPIYNALVLFVRVAGNFRRCWRWKRGVGSNLCRANDRGLGIGH